MADRYDDDGHTITLVAESCDGEDGVRVESISCPGEGACQAGYMLCSEWDSGCSGGDLYDENDENTGACEVCKGTGKLGGEHHCWLASPDGQSAGYDWSDAIEQNLAYFAPGTYRLLVAANGEGPEEWFVRLWIGERIADPADPIGGQTNA